VLAMSAQADQCATVRGLGLRAAICTRVHCRAEQASDSTGAQSHACGASRYQVGMTRSSTLEYQLGLFGVSEFRPYRPEGR
jgi:hypothetical protein